MLWQSSGQIRHGGLGLGDEVSHLDGMTSVSSRGQHWESGRCPGAEESGCWKKGQDLQDWRRPGRLTEEAGDGLGPGQECLLGRTEEANKDKGEEVKLPCGGAEPKGMFLCLCSRLGAFHFRKTV